MLLEFDKYQLLLGCLNNTCTVVFYYTHTAHCKLPYDNSVEGTIPGMIQLMSAMVVSVKHLLDNENL